MAQINDTECVVDRPEPGVLANTLAGEPIRVVELAAHEGLGGAVVHVHGEDGVLADRHGPKAADIRARQEIDGHELRLVVQHARIGRTLAEGHVDVPVEEVDVAVAAPLVAE